MSSTRVYHILLSLCQHNLFHDHVSHLVLQLCKYLVKFLATYFTDIEFLQRRQRLSLAPYLSTRRRRRRPSDTICAPITGMRRTSQWRRFANPLSRVSKTAVHYPSFEKVHGGHNGTNVNNDNARLDGHGKGCYI